MSFKDHFSGHAGDYAKYRPAYPDALFAYLASIVPVRELAWDCGTGNGQAAVGLAKHFARVVATDPSRQQITNAILHARVQYGVASDVAVDLPAGSVDLVTAAQAAHWFDLPAFYGEVARVLKPHGAIAIWCYGLSAVCHDVDRLVAHYYRDVVGPYWPPERRYIDECYATLAFPFAEELVRDLQMEQRWNLQDFVSYLHTWSATKAFQRAQGHDPLAALAPQLAEAWGAPADVRTVRWPIHLRIGR